jgi:hypothetical protein
MNKITDQSTIYTDTSGVKRDAIEGVFKTNFKTVHTIDSESLGGKTPLDLETLISETQNRLDFLSKKIPMAGKNDYCATIQRGFYSTENLWHLIARVGISHYAGITSSYPEATTTSFTSSVPIPKKVSLLKTKNPNGNIKDFLEQVYPDFNKEKISMFSYLTGEDEKMWFQQPLRHCLKDSLRG